MKQDKTTKKTTEQISFRMPTDVLQLLDEEADLHGFNRTQVLVRVLQNHYFSGKSPFAVDPKSLKEGGDIPNHI